MTEYEPNLDPVLPPPLAEDSGAGTDLWFARRFAKEHGPDLKYVRAWKQWVAWLPDEGRWQRDDTDAEWSCAKVTVQRIVAEAGKLAVSDEARAKMLNKAAHRFMGGSAVEVALKVSRSEEAIRARTDDWDSHPHLLNCTNGTIDLRTGELLPHRRTDRLTKTTNVTYDKGATAPLFQKFLERIIPDPELRAYLQRALGYSAIGSVTEQILFVAWGGGANGKSVLFNTVSATLGEYAISVPTELLVTASQFDHPTVKTILRSARFALASETPEGGKFNEQQLKALTGGDKISARGMRENFYEFDPTHTLFLQTNHRPHVKETTLAFWRRIRLMQFTVTIPKDEQDKDLTVKLAAELPGILAWIVAGAAAYLRDGMQEPAAVLAATAEYQADQDPFREFLDLYEPGDYTSSPQLHSAFVEWATSQGIKPWGMRTLSAKLKERGWTPTQPRGSTRGFCVRRRSETISPVNIRSEKLRETHREKVVPNDDNQRTAHFGPAAGSAGTTTDWDDDESLGNMADEAQNE